MAKRSNRPRKGRPIRQNRPEWRCVKGKWIKVPVIEQRK